LLPIFATKVVIGNLGMKIVVSTKKEDGKEEHKGQGKQLWSSCQNLQSTTTTK
jgi:hypothetical protein